MVKQFNNSTLHAFRYGLIHTGKYIPKKDYMQRTLWKYKYETNRKLHSPLLCYLVRYIPPPRLLKKVKVVRQYTTNYTHFLSKGKNIDLSQNICPLRWKGLRTIAIILCIDILCPIFGDYVLLLLKYSFFFVKCQS